MATPFRRRDEPNFPQHNALDSSPGLDPIVGTLLCQATVPREDPKWTVYSMSTWGHPL